MEIEFKFWGVENHGKYISRVYLEVDGVDAGFVEYRSSRAGGASHSHTIDDGLYNELVEIMSEDWIKFFGGAVDNEYKVWRLFSDATPPGSAARKCEYTNEYKDGIIIDYAIAA